MINGLSYITNFISCLEQEFLISEIDKMPWSIALKRRTQHYGYEYNYTHKKIDNSSYVGEIPDFLNKYCHILTEKELFKETPNQVIINEYLPGQGISRHVDCVSCFKETVASLSLSSTCIMEFEQLYTHDKKYLLLEPLSLLVLSNEARYRWMHSIPARRDDNWDDMVFPRARRVSLTFRKVILS